MDRKPILIICAAGLALRFAFIVFSGQDLTFPDEYRFLEEAESLLAGTGFQFDGRFAHDMPMTAFFIAGIMAITSDSIWAVKCAMAMVSTATIYLIARVTFALSRENGAAVIAGTIAAAYPFFIFYSSLLLSETLFLLFLLALFLSVIDGEKATYKQGLLAGLAHLTRPTLIFFLPVILSWQIIFKRIALRQLLLSVLVFAIVLSPWIVRNYGVFDAFVPSTASSGHILWEGNNPWNNTGGVSGTFEDGRAWLEVVPKGLTELQEDEWKKSQALAFIKENPAKFFFNGIKKTGLLWNLWPNTSEYQAWYYKVISVASFGSILLLCIFGCFSLKKLREEIILFVLFAGYITALQIVTLGSIRYRLPLEPFMIVISSIFLYSKWGRAG